LTRESTIVLSATPPCFILIPNFIQIPAGQVLINQLMQKMLNMKMTTVLTQKESKYCVTSAVPILAMFLTTAQPQRAKDIVLTPWR